MPNTTSAPSSSSERTIDWAPEQRVGAPVGGAGLGRVADGGWGAPGGGVGRGVAVVMKFSPHVWLEITAIWATKNPRRPRLVVRGVRVDVPDFDQASTRLRSTRTLLLDTKLTV
jgi:hypothetical protein